MDMKAEAQRVMAVALSKMYTGRLQRGGARLHRSLLLSLVLRGAQDVYLGLRAARGGPGRQLEAESGAGAAAEVRAPSPAPGVEFMDCSAQPVVESGRLEGIEPPAVSAQLAGSDPRGTPCPEPRPGQEVPADKRLVPRPDRSRKRRKDCPEPEALPTKRARLEEEEGGETRALAASLGSGPQVKVKEQPVNQGQIWRDRVLGELSMWVRPIVAY
ncbi:immediate early response gene 2 protein-like [Narcine bancroftii]|uniref:immediate early response gene 2 protein-like n=1 Tax=Narcine bancroftii TaxID=1343680 RepID=UPI0038314AFA